MKNPVFALLILSILYSCASKNSNYISNATKAKDCNIDISGIWEEYYIREIRRRFNPKENKPDYKIYSITSNEIIGPGLNTTYFFEKDCVIKAYAGGSSKFEINTKFKDTLIWTFNFNMEHQRIIYLKRR